MKCAAHHKLDVENRIGPHQDQEVESFIFYHQMNTINLHLHASIPQSLILSDGVFYDNALLSQLPPSRRSWQDTLIRRYCSAEFLQVS